MIVANVGAGADDQPACPREASSADTGVCPNSSRYGFDGLLSATLDDDVVVVFPPSTSMDPNRSSRTCMPSPPGGPAAGAAHRYSPLFATPATIRAVTAAGNGFPLSQADYGWRSGLGPVRPRRQASRPAPCSGSSAPADVGPYGATASGVSNRADLSEVRPVQQLGSAVDLLALPNPNKMSSCGGSLDQSPEGQ